MRFLILLLLLFTSIAIAVPTTPTPPLPDTLLLTDVAPSSNTSRRHSFKCQTTGASPRIVDITWAILALKDRGGNCRQSNLWFWGSHCTKVANYRTAQISVCGSNNHFLPCTEIARGAMWVRDWCRSGDRAGGIYNFDNSQVDSVLH